MGMHVQSCLTPCNLRGSSLHGVLQQEYWSGLPFALTGNIPDPRIKPTFPVSPILVGGFFTTDPSETLNQCRK